MGAENPQRRKTTAREAAEKLGVHPRTIRRIAAEPRTEYLARAAVRREQAARLRNEGRTYIEIAAVMECSTGTVGTLIRDAKKHGIVVR
jgi:DNA-directed RNA polymerase specialized sigma24 family protein